MPIVTIRNDSNRRIEGLRLRFKAGTETHAVSGRRVNLAPGSTYVYRSNALLEGDPRAVTVQLLGVRFEDGGTWGTLDSTIDTRTPWIGGEAPPVD